MKIWAIMMVKDEADVIRYLLEHLARQGVDGVLIADNISMDNTLVEIAEAAPRPTTMIVKDWEVAYYQGRKMTRLAENVIENFGADWVLPIDADEWWYVPMGTIRETLQAADTAQGVVSVEMVNHFCTALDEDSRNPFERMCWAREDSPCLAKVCFSKEVGPFDIAMGNHHLYQKGTKYAMPVSRTVKLKARHLPFRSAEHFVRKARNGGAAYKATVGLEDYGGHWRGYADLLEKSGEQAAKDWFYKWFYYPQPKEAGLIYSPLPR